MIAGVVADRYLETCPTRAWAFLAFAAATAGLFLASRPRAATCAVLAAWFALASGWHHSRWYDLDAHDMARVVTESPRPVWARGALIDTLGFRPGLFASDPGLTRAVIALTAVHGVDGWRLASGRALLAITGDRSDLQAGATVEAAGTLALVPGPRNPGEFDYRAHLRADGVRLRLAVKVPEAIWLPARSETGPSSWSLAAARLIGAARAGARDRLAAVIDPSALPLASALVLGRREGIDPEVNDAFNRTGTSHLLAISGLHLQALAFAVSRALTGLGLRRRPTFALVFISTILYALLVGLMPSVVRSAVMTAAGCLAGLTDRKGRAGDALALAAILTLAWNPADLFDVGCQLSFLAVAVLIWIVAPAASAFQTWRDGGPLDRLERRFASPGRALLHRGRSTLEHGLILSALVWVAAAPLVALRFHLLAPVGVILNLPLVPITSLALLSSIIALAISPLSLTLARPFGAITGGLLALTEKLVRWGADRPWGSLYVAEPATAWVLAFYALGALALAAQVGKRSRRTRVCTAAAWAAAIFLPAAASLASHGSTPALRADILSVGHGLAVVVQTGDGRALLYDCGKMREPAVGRRVILPALAALGIQALDTVVLSHADADHYNGLADLLGRVRIGEVLIPEGFASAANPGTAALLDRARARGATVSTVAAGDTWRSRSGLATFHILHPPPGWRPDLPDNARSLVLDVSSLGRHALLTGDLEGEGLRRLTSVPPPDDPEVLLAPHHGARAANPPALYLWASPRIVAVSQREPAANGADPPAALGIPVLRTWERGAVRLDWSAEGIRASGFLDEAGSTPPGRARR